VFFLYLIPNIVCGCIAAAIANSKGRSTVGWFFGGFFLGLIGIVIIAVISNRKEEAARHAYLENERRRLREQLHQERIKSDAFRQYSVNRLDAHDQALGIDTRPPTLLEGGQPPSPGLLDGPGGDFFNQFQSPPEPAIWYYERGGNAVGPVPEKDIRALLAARTLTPESLVWTEGFADWQPLGKTPPFNAMGAL